MNVKTIREMDAKKKGLTLEGHVTVRLIPKCAFIASKILVLHKQNLQSHPGPPVGRTER